ncbi:MAG: hypothetical protein C4519_04595 [Desulfobacteraceae bacterium]|nr:MAG: hypothetical protein C4519_04595 [Desulfobacteraceae bacterium]
MSEKHPETSNPSAHLSAMCDEHAQSLKLTADALVELNIARKNMLIYPESHEQVRRSAQRSGHAMRKSAERFATLQVVVLQEQLAIGTQPLEARSTALKELVTAFKKRGIAAITFGKEFTEAEWFGFVKLLALDPEEIQRQGGIQAASAGRVLSTIILHPVDYSKLQVTEEQEIQPSPVAPKSGATWNLFVSHMLSGMLAEKDAPGLTAMRVYDPEEMAGLLNANKLSPDQAVAYYQALIAQYLETASEDKEAVFHSGLESFSLLVKELKPELQEQFVSAALDQCGRHDPSAGAADVVRGMDADLVARMLRLANAEGRPISPSLLAFVGKMGFITGPPKEAAGLSALQPEHEKNLQVLLEREAYENFVDDGYAGMLKELSDPPAGGGSDDLAQLKKELAEELEEASIAARVALDLIGLMAGSLTVEEYRDWARQLTFLLDDLLELHAYGVLIKIWDDVQAARQTQASSEKAKISGLVLDHFTAPAFLARAVESIHRPAGNIAGQALEFLERMGEPVVAEALECWGGDEKYQPESAIMQLLSHLPAMAAAEALERLSDPRPYFVCRMLEVVRRFGSAEHAEGIKALLAHRVEDVRMEALATLLRFNNAWGVLRVRELMAQQWSPSAQKAIQLCGYYKIKEAVPALLALIERAGSLGADIERREAAMRALGQIGDPGCLANLSRIARRRWSLSPKPLLHLKRVLFESLEGFPFEAVKELLHIGLRQKDHVIAATCERAMKRGFASQAGERK